MNCVDPFLSQHPLIFRDSQTNQSINQPIQSIKLELMSQNTHRDNAVPSSGEDKGREGERERVSRSNNDIKY